jgi:hypothetical protein
MLAVFYVKSQEVKHVQGLRHPKDGAALYS